MNLIDERSVFILCRRFEQIGLKSASTAPTPFSRCTHVPNERTTHAPPLQVCFRPFQASFKTVRVRFGGHFRFVAHIDAFVRREDDLFPRFPRVGVCSLREAHESRREGRRRAGGRGDGEREEGRRGAGGGTMGGGRGGEQFPIPEIVRFPSTNGQATTLTTHRLLLLPASSTGRDGMATALGGQGRTSGRLI